MQQHSHLNGHSASSVKLKPIPQDYYVSKSRVIWQVVRHLEIGDVFTCHDIHSLITDPRIRIENVSAYLGWCHKKQWFDLIGRLPGKRKSLLKYKMLEQPDEPRIFRDPDLKRDTPQRVTTHDNPANLRFPVHQQLPRDVKIGDMIPLHLMPAITRAPTIDLSSASTRDLIDELYRRDHKT